MVRLSVMMSSLGAVPAVSTSTSWAGNTRHSTVAASLVVLQYKKSGLIRERVFQSFDKFMGLEALKRKIYVEVNWHICVCVCLKV